MTEKESILERIKEVAGWNINVSRFKIVTDTSDWMRIHRGDVIKIYGHYFLIKGNMREPRFGIDEQPKYWVFSAIDLSDASEKIIKAIFKEEFYAHIGILKVRCYRDVDKESKVLVTCKGDKRFMQGKTYFDEKGNNVRVIDYIHGTSFLNYIPNIPKQHKEYFYEDMPHILHKLYDSILAIKFLHDNELCHGDIRNDHLFIETETGDYRWIDFDLKQDVSDFDQWSIGNILSYAVVKGIMTFDRALKSKEFSDDIKNSLKASDGSAFYEYRIMHLRKLYPYIPERLSNILQHFTIQPIAFYSKIDQFVDDYKEMLDKEFPL